MTIRVVNTTVTVPALADPYSTPPTFMAGTVPAVTPGGVREAAIAARRLRYAPARPVVAMPRFSKAHPFRRCRTPEAAADYRAM
jgi:hypothetical protein